MENTDSAKCSDSDIIVSLASDLVIAGRIVRRAADSADSATNTVSEPGETVLQVADMLNSSSETSSLVSSETASKVRNQR